MPHLNIIIPIGCLLIALSFLLYPYWHRNIILKKWYKKLDLNKHHSNYQQLFKGCDGFALSRQARIKNDAMEYTYGEIEFIPFIALLAQVKPNFNTVFYDLGSGIGKAVFACAMVFDVKKSCGIELFSLLHEAAVGRLQVLQQQQTYALKAKSIHLINDDFLNVNFSDATLIFINATALFGETWITLNNRLAKLAPTATVITTSKKLMADNFSLEKIIPVQMSWGRVYAFIHQPIIIF